MFPAQHSITVAIPTYNRASLLAECLKHVLEVIGPSDRIVISDNASTDETPEVIRQVFDPRITATRNATNLGIFGNLNRCLELVETEFVLFLSDDDRIDSRLLPTCSSALAQSEAVAAIVSNRYLTIAGSGEVYSSEVKSGLRSGIYVGDEVLSSLWRGEISFQLCGVLFRTDALRRIGGFSLDHKYAGDLVTYSRLFIGAAVAFEAEPMCEYRVHQSSESSRLEVKSKFGDLISLFEELQAVAKARLPSDRVHRLRCGLERYIVSEYRRQSVDFVAAGGRWLDFFSQSPPAFFRAAGYALKRDNRDLRFFQTTLSRVTPLWLKELRWTAERLLHRKS